MTEENSRRPILNGRSILTMWLASRLIARNLQDFYLQKPCKLILAKFKKFTNLREKELIFDEEDQIFLDKFTQEFKGACVSFNMVRHHSNSRKMWEAFFTETWESSGFEEFEQRYVGRILIPEAIMDDKNVLSISDKLSLFDELCSFSSELKLAPSETQLISSLYDLSGLTEPEKDKLLRDGKKMKDYQNQKDKIAAKLTAAQSELQSLKRLYTSENDEAKKAKNILQQLLDFQHAKNADLEAQIVELKMNLEAVKQELGKQCVDAIPICHICQEVTTVGSQTKLLGCCGYPIHTKCFENLCMAHQQHRPPCPQCRETDFVLTPLTRNHHLLRHQTAKEKKDSAIAVCEADFLEGVIGGEKFEPILKEDRKLSIYELMIRKISLPKASIHLASGGGAARR